MSFPFNIYFTAFAAAFFTAWASLPLWRRFCLRTGLVDDPGHRKIHEKTIPLAGGLAVMTGLALPLAVAALLIWTGQIHLLLPDRAAAAPLLDYGFSRRGLQLAAILFGAAGMLLIGLLDDRFELKPGPKFFGQCAIAALVAAAGIRITLFVDNALFSYVITIFWILTITNAFNFMDNMNGLCSGLGAIGSWCFAWNAAVAGQYLVSLLGFLVCGALLGFLPWNFPKASAFLGDAGSHLTGFVLAVLAILPSFYSPENPRALAVLSPLLILAVLLWDLGSVVIIRTRAGKPFYVGDNNHLSHRLARRGWSRAQAVLILWLLAALAGFAAFALSHWVK